MPSLSRVSLRSLASQKPVLEGEGVQYGAINDDGLVFRRGESEFLYQFPLELAGAGIKKRSKGLPDSGFMADIELPELV